MRQVVLAIVFLGIIGLGFAIATSDSYVSCSPKPPELVVVPGADLRFITREGWDARAPTGGMSNNTPYRISIHHTAILQEPSKAIEIKMREMQSWHLKKGQPDISYHFFIDYKGTIAEGRELRNEVAPSAGYDGSGIIHITLEGDFTQEPVNDLQIDSLTRLLRFLRRLYDISPEAIQGHKDFTSETVCPGTLYEFLPQIRDEVK